MSVCIGTYGCCERCAKNNLEKDTIETTKRLHQLGERRQYLLGADPDSDEWETDFCDAIGDWNDDRVCFKTKLTTWFTFAERLYPSDSESDIKALSEAEKHVTTALAILESLPLLNEGELVPPVFFGTAWNVREPTATDTPRISAATQPDSESTSGDGESTSEDGDSTSEVGNSTSDNGQSTIEDRVPTADKRGREKKRKRGRRGKRTAADVSRVDADVSRIDAHAPQVDADAPRINVDARRTEAIAR